MFLKPFLVLIGLLIVGKLLTPIIVGLAIGIFITMLMCNMAEGPIPAQFNHREDDF